MKRCFKIKLCAFMSVALMLTGCANNGAVSSNTDVSDNNGSSASDTGVSDNNGSEIQLVPIKEVREGFDKSVENVKAQTFDNINFENAIFSFTDADEFYALKYNENTDFITLDEECEYLCERVRELLPEKFAGASDEEIEKYIEMFGFKDVHPTVSEYKKDKEKYELSPGVTRLTIAYKNRENPNQESVFTYNGILYGFSNGELIERSGIDLSISNSHYEGYYKMLDPLSDFNVIYRTLDNTSDKKFILDGSEVSISDAKKNAEKILSDLELSKHEVPFKPSIKCVNVVDLGNGDQAFIFSLTKEYKGLEYHFSLPDEGLLFVDITYDSTNVVDIGGYLSMCRPDELCEYALDQAHQYNIEETDRFSSVIPLEKAAEAVSEHLTAGMSFKALSVSAVYKTFSSEDRFEAHRDITARPCWRFVLKPINEKNMYYIFVDMQTGKIKNFIQVFTSEAEYD